MSTIVKPSAVRVDRALALARSRHSGGALAAHASAVYIRLCTQCTALLCPCGALPCCTLAPRWGGCMRRAAAAVRDRARPEVYAGLSAALGSSGGRRRDAMSSFPPPCGADQMQHHGACPPSSSITGEGPYVWTVVHGSTTSVRPCAKHGGSRPVHLPIVVTVPAAAAASSGVPLPPYPVCVLINGFQARASQYSPYAQRLASWGFMVVQYNAPPWTIIPDAAELPFLRNVLQWLRQHSSPGAHACARDSGCSSSSSSSGAPGSELACAFPALQGRADMSRLVVAGHSRGAKLAALHFAAGSSGHGGGADFKAAFLIDPVNNTERTPVSAGYPDAVAALKACGKPVGIAGAGIVGPANPAGANWKLFQSAAAPGSWRLLLPEAGHTTFLSPAAAWETWLLDKCFGGGPMPRDRVVSLTAATMAAWFWQQLAAADPAEAPGGAVRGEPSAAQEHHDAAGGGGGVAADAAPHPAGSAAAPAADAAEAALAHGSAVKAISSAIVTQQQQQQVAAASAPAAAPYMAWGDQLTAAFLRDVGLQKGSSEALGLDYALLVQQ